MSRPTLLASAESSSAPAVQATTQVSCESQARTLGAANDVAGLERLFPTVPSSTRQMVADMALVGASENKAREAGAWAVRNGACELWGIQQEPNLWRRVGKDTNRALKMLGGPGEVKKGTFK